MNLVILYLSLMQRPQLEDLPNGGFSSAITFQQHPETVVRIFTNGSSDLLLDITERDGKTLVVKKDGTVTGELAKDQAALAFWQAVAKAFPKTCGMEDQPK